MARDFIINGETLVKVRGVGALGAGSSILDPLGIDVGQPVTRELGLCSPDECRVIPRFIHQDVYCDDFGPHVPSEVMCLLADCTIRMTLVHYDKDILDACLAQSMGGGVRGTFAGTLPGAGTLLGNNKSPGDVVGSNFVQLILTSPVLQFPWRFLASYLWDRPLEKPLGTQRTQATLMWRAVPYTVQQPGVVSNATTVVVLRNGRQETVTERTVTFREQLSAGATLWDHGIDNT